MKPYYTNVEEKGYITKVANTPEEALALGEAGFIEYSVWGEKHLFKKKAEIT
jgi:hypothetical protein